MLWLDIKEFIKDALKYIVTAIIVILIFLYVLSMQQIIGPSMSPTLTDGDLVLLDKISLRFTDIKRNQIVSINYADTKYLIKRVVGLPGEYVEFKNNVLYVDGTAYKETFLGEDVVTEDFSIKDLGYDKIPDDMYLVLGDNRSNSKDSRDPDVGLIKKEDIIGKVFFQFWPLNEISFVK